MPATKFCVSQQECRTNNTRNIERSHDNPYIPTSGTEVNITRVFDAIGASQYVLHKDTVCNKDVHKVMSNTCS